MNVSFLGLGLMGSRMAKNLLKNNIHLKAYNRTRGNVKDDELKNILNSSPGECVKNADVIFTMLSEPPVVDEIAFGENGFIKDAKHNAVWIDCSTVDPAFSRSTADRAAEYSVRFFDIPVSGSLPQAEKAQLIFLAGASVEELKNVKYLLDYMGSKIIYGGKIGNGSNLKLLINAMLGESMAAFSETVGLGLKMGFNKNSLIDILSDLTVTPPFIKFKSDMLKNDTYIVNFPLEWMHKDMKLLGKTAEELDKPLYIADIVEQLFQKAKDMGLGREDFAAIFRSLNNSIEDKSN